VLSAIHDVGRVTPWSTTSRGSSPPASSDRPAPSTADQTSSTVPWLFPVGHDCD
jgi:hypothetical protein